MHRYYRVMTRLADLGPRICIFGPSNSGKSTLAVAIGTARKLPVIHLDQLYHLPQTNWVPRPSDEFGQLHDTAIAGDNWVIDGNYSRLIPLRLGHATGVIRLECPTMISLGRYFRRAWFDRHRRGAIVGGRDPVNWPMLWHIAVVVRRNRGRDLAQFDSVDLPKIRLSTARDVAALYRTEGLER